MGPTAMQGATSLYESSELYALLFGARTHDIPHYRRVAAHRGASASVLDLGAGDGRLAVPLARAGHPVLGVDDAAAMTAAFAARAAAEPPAVRARLRCHRGCARRLRLAERFDVVQCAFNGIAHHLDAGALAAFFETVRLHLAPDGLLAFDALVPEGPRLEGSTTEIPWFRHPERGTVCRATEQVSYDPHRRHMRVALEIRFMEEEREPERRELVLRLEDPARWVEALERHRFALVETTHLGDVVAFQARPTG